jgi:outer membrane protein
MYKKLLFCLLVQIFLFSGLMAQSKVGYIISDQILQDFPEAQAASKKLEGMRKEAMADLDSLQKEIQAKLADYQQKESLMTEDAKKKTQKDLYDMDAKLKEITQKKSDALKKENETLMKPIIERMNAAIDLVAKEEGFSVILDKNVILYGEPQINITNKVLDIMMRGGKATPKKKGK